MRKSYYLFIFSGASKMQASGHYYVAFYFIDLHGCEDYIVNCKLCGILTIAIVQNFV